VSLGVALLVLAGVVGIILALWLEPSPGDPATFRIERGAVRSEGGRFYLPVTIMNEGDLTASQVTVEGELTVNGHKEEVSTTFDFIPGHAEVAGVLIFSHDPEAAEAQVSSYQQP
jgi:uncharacterized protein (TIGR02588 family)